MRYKLDKEIKNSPTMIQHYIDSVKRAEESKSFNRAMVVLDASGFSYSSNGSHNQLEYWVNDTPIKGTLTFH
jgi:hypothetical protein